MKKYVLVTICILLTLSVCSQELNSGTTICWDVSSSMDDRDLQKDFSVLEKVFQKTQNQQVQLLLFGIKLEEKNYNISNGDWSTLKQDLQNTIYDGGTIYSILKDKIKNSNVYVFTDGRKSLNNDVLVLPQKSFLINSNVNRDAKFLERTALLNKSRMMDFAAILPENVKQLQNKNEEKRIEQKPEIKGTVFINNEPAADVKISLKGLPDSFLSNAEGVFSVPATVGDTLVLTSRNSRTIKTIPVEFMSHLNVFMSSNTVELDEVIVMEEKLKKAEMINTGFGLQRKESIGYVISEVDEKDISEISTTIGDAINTKVPGLQIPGQNPWERSTGGLGAAKIRGSGTINMNTNALVVVNGVPMQRSETNRSGAAYVTSNVNMDYIDPSNIANIKVLKGLAATNLYGSEGRGGVILITTKTAAISKSQKGKPQDQALLKNNVYSDSQSAFESDLSLITNALNKSKTVTDAYETYLTLKNLNQANISFYLDAFDYFKTKDALLAGKIISNLLEWNSDSVEVLRIISSAMTSIGDYENVILINEEILKVMPTDVNAYFNKAISLNELGQHQEALKELQALQKGNSHSSVDASAISKTLKRQIKNLISRNKNKLNLANVEADALNNVKYKARFVFEWNLPAAEFELQFVNPQKRFFNWEHTNSSLKSRIENEIDKNYRIEEYEFYGDVQGKWIINAKYLGDAKVNNEVPLVVKCTIFKNFGYPNQSKEDIFAYFTKFNEKKNLKTLIIN